MNKTQYLKIALKKNLLEEKAWHLVCFSLSRFKSREDRVGPLYPFTIQGNSKIFIETEDKDIPIEDDIDREPLFRYNDPIEITSGDIANYTSDKPLMTSVGNLIYNHLCIAIPFGDLIPYQEGLVNVKKVEQMIAKLALAQSITAEQIIAYGDSIALIEGLSQLAAPAASAKSITIDPAIIKRRDELFEQYKGQLNDPVIVAKIGDELEALDREYIKGDDSEKFFIKDKSFNVSRKKQYLFMGIESGFEDGTQSNFIPNSLQEGWNFDFMPEMVNSLRAGSFNRGNLTALGGESVKYFYRIFQTVRVSQPDCGVTNGMFWSVTKENVNNFVGSYIIRDGKSELITEEIAKSSLNKQIEVRTPMLCKTSKPGYCERCVGSQLSQSPNGLHIAASDVGSRFMGIFMASMHGKSLSTNTFNLKELIT